MKKIMEMLQETKLLRKQAFEKSKVPNLKKVLLIIPVIMLLLSSTIGYVAQKSAGTINVVSESVSSEQIASNNSDANTVKLVAKATPKKTTSVTTKQTKAVADSIAELKIHYIDVGQGDCTLITCDGHYMLIDAGNNNKGTAVQNYLTKQGIKNLDYVIGTHPDSDHIGGLDVVIYKFTCSTVIMPGITSKTATYRDVVDTMTNKGYKNTLPVVGTTYTLGDATFTIIAPNKSYSKDTNNSSVGIKLTHGDNTFLFTGDAENKAEDDILSNGIDISADVYMVPHHGSDTASSQDFLDAVKPTYAVISCGEGNSYGHPSSDTLNKLREMGVQVFRTDEQGTIIATSDGKTITWNCSPSVTWQDGEATSTKAATSTKTETSTKAAKSAKTAIASSSASTTAAATATLAAAEAAPAATDQTVVVAPASTPTGTAYVVNTNTGKFHLPTCYSVATIHAENRLDVTTTRDDLINQGYVPCKNCNP